MPVTSPKKWSLGKAEFGNVEQIDYLQKEAKEEKQIKEAMEKDLVEIDYEEVTQYIATCSNCGYAGEPEESKSDAKSWITDCIGYNKGKAIGVCQDCGLRLE